MTDRLRGQQHLLGANGDAFDDDAVVAQRAQELRPGLAQIVAPHWAETEKHDSN